MTPNEKINKYIINSSQKIKFNSKDIKKDDVFIALQGKNYHGNQFIYDAIRAGAKYCITDKKIEIIKNKKKVIFVKDNNPKLLVTFIRLGLGIAKIPNSRGQPQELKG